VNRRRQALIAILSFVIGAVCAAALPKLTGSVADKLILPEDHRETARITSPDGTVDAVTELTECGAPCSSIYSVSIVPKGTLLSQNTVQKIFVADETVNLQVMWREPHLLEIAYDRAFILDFRNVAYPFGRSDHPESWADAVEIRLSPSSSRFSYLVPGGRGQN
jgi:hypothetical protein